MQPRKHLLTTFSVLLIAALLVACVSPAVAPMATPAAATPTLVPPTATLAPTVIVVPTATVQAPPATPASPGLEEQPSDVLSGFVENDGVRIHYQVQGEGPPLVLMHWLTGSLEDWRVFGYVDSLKESYRLILIDARGHGQSDKPHDPAAYVLEKQAGDIVAVLDKLGVDKAHYYGYSLGGELGWALAKYVPDRFSSLMIGGASPEDFDPSAEIARDRGLGAEEYGNMAAGVLSGYGFSRPKIYAIYAATDFEAVIADLQAISTPNFAADLPGMTMPVLLLAGTGDEDYRAMEAATSKLPNATFASLPGNDHMTAYLQTDLLVERLTKFLAQVEKAGLDDATVAEIEALVEQTMQKYSIPGFALGIVKDGHPIYAKGFGEGNVAEGNPVKPQSLFGLASISKMFTAAAIMQLAEQGLINLDAPVTDYLPYFRLDDPRYDEITVRQLLAHTSGLPWLPAQTEVRWEELGFHDPDTEEGALERMVRSLDSVALVADPGGDQVMYSNTAFDVLGDIVAKVSGQSYEAYMRDNIFEPLGMDQSTFALDEADPELLTTGYQRDLESGDLTAWEIFPFNPPHSPSAGLISNIDDMNRWALALLNQGELDGERVLEAESLDQMWSPSATMGWGGLLQDYGLGWILAEDAGHRFAWHVGGVPGFTSNLILAPDDGTAVVTLVNLNNYLTDEPWYATEVGTAIMVALLDIGQ